MTALSQGSIGKAVRCAQDPDSLKKRQTEADGLIAAAKAGRAVEICQRASEAKKVTDRLRDFLLSAVGLAATVLDFENTDYLRISIDPDGDGPKDFQVLSNFIGTPQKSISDGKTELTTEFKDVTFDVPAGATNLVVRFDAQSTFYNEIIAFDNVRITARPDRIDQMADGSLHIYDYKTGTPPSPDQQKYFDKQLLIEAAMAERGGFRGIGAHPVSAVTYIHLGTSAKDRATTRDEGNFDQVWDELAGLIGQYRNRSRGYAARRALFEDAEQGDYDHLSRHGEWQVSDPSEPEDVG